MLSTLSLGGTSVKAIGASDSQVNCLSSAADCVLKNVVEGNFGTLGSQGLARQGASKDAAGGSAVLLLYPEGSPGAAQYQVRAR